MMKLPLDKSDRQWLVASIIVPIVLWWLFTGRKKYSTKGMTR